MADDPISPGDKARTFPTSTGIYLMKDAEGRVVYIGKAKNLRSRASSYWNKDAPNDTRIRDWIGLVVEIDYIETEDEIASMLVEARMIKDLRPQFNKSLKDDKTFPYLQIRTREEFPRVEITRTPRRKGVRLYGPFTNTTSLRAAVHVLQPHLPVPNVHARHQVGRKALEVVSPLPAPQHSPLHRPVQPSREPRRVSPSGEETDLRARREEEQADRADGKGNAGGERALNFEKAKRLRDEIVGAANLDLRGDKDRDAQPEVFPIDPKKGLKGLQQVLGLAKRPRTIEGMDIAHISGTDTVASLVSFLDGLPFKPGYRRFKIKTVEGVDDFASMREVVSRRFRRLREEDEVFPDILLIDGGKGQLNAAMQAFKALGIEPPCVISLAKQEEEIFRPGESESIKLSRRSAALRLVQYVRDESHRRSTTTTCSAENV